VIYFFRTLKSIFFWSYARNTWQYDVLCVLILAFIFLTPKSWFETSELRNAPAHQSRFAQSLVVVLESPTGQLDRGEIERRVRALRGPQTEVLKVREQLAENGKTVTYEVDIR
jgi:hypothetical protein